MSSLMVLSNPRCLNSLVTQTYTSRGSVLEVKWYRIKAHVGVRHIEATNSLAKAGAELEIARAHVGFSPIVVKHYGTSTIFKYLARSVGRRKSRQERLPSLSKDIGKTCLYFSFYQLGGHSTRLVSGLLQTLLDFRSSFCVLLISVSGYESTHLNGVCRDWGVNTFLC